MEKYYPHGMTRAITQTMGVLICVLFGSLSCKENASDSVESHVCPISDFGNGAYGGGQPFTSCWGKRYSWNPETLLPFSADFYVEYQVSVSDTDSGEVAPPDCPALPEGFRFQNDKENVDVYYQTKIINGARQRVLIRRCMLPPLPSPLECDSASIESVRTDTDGFGWLYCEAHVENSALGCSDGRDNDGDARIDGADDDCTACLQDTEACSEKCPQQLHLTPVALDLVNTADGYGIRVQSSYRFKDPNCSENTRANCLDGADNDHNGSFDCQNVFDGTTPHFADPDCCPLKRDEFGRCQFTTADGEPAETEAAAWVSICETTPTPKGMPDACCEASRAVLCDLPEPFKTECALRQ